MLSRVAFICLLSTQAATAADFDFIFGAGFDNTTPVTPEGGNPATTLGEARRNVLIEAGRIWGALLVSNVRISVRAQFVDDQECTATTGTLASAGATNLFRNFSGAPANTFFVSALANAIAGRDLNTGTPDINVSINSKVNGSTGCLGGRRFYLGFDNNTASISPRGIDLLAVALHELSHGFGFSSEIRLTGNAAGQTADSSGAVSGYVQQIFDEQLGRAWPMLSPAERVQSATRTGLLAWNGSRTNAQAARFPGGITGQGRFQLNAPPTIDEGSSVSHWSPTFINPNLLMEPNISSTLTSIVDVTPCALQDIGWQVTRCPDAAGPASPNAPTTSPQTVTLVEDTSVVISFMATDPDPNTTLTFSTSAPLRGTLTATGNPATRTYTPNPNEFGQDNFTFTASDGANTSAPAPVTINITGVNDPPTVSNLIIGAGSGQSATIPLPGSDVDFDFLSYELLTMPANGTLTGVGSSVLTYVSNNGFAGADSFTFRARDRSTVSAPATVTINVVAATPPPSTTPAPGGRGGGGGAMNELLLLALGLLAITARLYKLRTASPRRAR